MKFQLLILCCVFGSIFGGKLAGYYEVGHPPLTGRIVGGKVAAEGLAPYQCSMQGYGKHNCGCAIISHHWVLTAAHCIKPYSAKNLKILVGTNNLKSGGKLYNVQKLIPHEEYNQPNFANDIGLILIDGQIEFNEKVQPIKYSNKFVNAGAKLRVTGWGRLGAQSSSPTLLQVLDVNAISNDECSKSGAPVHESHLCTFSRRGEGVCSGDSGGPLVRSGEVVGIANFAKLCALGAPDGFARVSYFYDWIKSHVEA